MNIGTVRTAPDRPIVYLDQNHWIDMARHSIGSPQLSPERRKVCQRIAELAEAGQIILPVSAAHLGEIAKKADRQRTEVAQITLKLPRLADVQPATRRRPRTTPDLRIERTRHLRRCNSTSWSRLTMCDDSRIHSLLLDLRTARTVNSIELLTAQKPLDQIQLSKSVVDRTRISTRASSRRVGGEE